MPDYDYYQPMDAFPQDSILDPLHYGNARVPTNAMDNTNENYISHCDKCYFYFDELASNTYHYLDSNISSKFKLKNYADNIYLTKNHFYKQGRSPPVV